MRTTVKNMTNNKGNKVPNQFIIGIRDNGRYHSDTFQSYSTNISRKIWDHKKRSVSIYLDEKYWDCSKTTGKYRNIFLDENIKETRIKIHSREYKLINLN